MMKCQKSFHNNNSTLYLVATPIGNLDEFTPRAINILKEVDYIACEDTRNTKRLLEHFNIEAKLLAYHNFNEKESSDGLIKLLKNKHHIALVSDAGYPLVSDPGYNIVNKAIENDINVVTISGPSAFLNALVASGLDTMHYLFYGFLNEKTNKAKNDLEALKDLPYTLIFYEAPHRIESTLKILFEVFGNRKACIARELTKLHEEYIRGHLEDFLNIADLKGEIVILIEGYHKSDEVIEYDKINTLIDNLINDGLSAKDAIKKIAKDYHLSKNDIYQNYQANKKPLN